MVGFRKIFSRMALLFVSLLLCAGGAELFLRAIGISYPIFSVPDPVTGAWHRPGARGWYRGEGEAFVAMNSVGMRDREHSLEKPVDVFRVAVLGDSYAEAMQVEVEQAFWAILEQELAGCPGLDGRRVEALNFGVSGFGTAQELLTWRARGRSYDADLVLLAFVHNDVRNNSRALERDDGRPYFVFDGESLVLDDSFRRTDLYRLRTSRWRGLRRAIAGGSRLMQLVNEVAQVPLRREMARTLPATSSHMYSPPSEPDWIEAWAVTDALLIQLAEEVEAVGSRFLLVSLTDWPQVHPDLELRAQFAAANGVQDYDYSEHRLAELAESADFAFLPLAPDLRSQAESRGECLHGFSNAEPCAGHWNALGHVLGGQRMARHVCGMLSSPSQRVEPAEPAAGSG